MRSKVVPKELHIKHRWTRHHNANLCHLLWRKSNYDLNIYLQLLEDICGYNKDKYKDKDRYYNIHFIISYILGLYYIGIVNQINFKLTYISESTEVKSPDQQGDEAGNAGVVVGGKVPIVITSRSDEAQARLASIAAAVVALD